MILPFDLPKGHLPVIVPCPKVRQVTLADGSLEYEAYSINHFLLQSDRGLYDIGFMLNLMRFAKLNAAEKFTILVLQSRLTFSDKLRFPNLRETGDLIWVERSGNKSVWAAIPSTVITTSNFTVHDLHDQCMALDEPDVLREVIQRNVQDCPDADVEENLNRFLKFTPPHTSDISRALKALAKLGIVREYVKIDRLRSRAVFNMRLVAATRSGIIRGMIMAADRLSRADGTEVTFNIDLKSVEPTATRVNSTSTGRRRILKRADYQSKLHSAQKELNKAESLIAAYEINGCLTPEQFSVLKETLDDQTVSAKLCEKLKRIFASAHTDLAIDIPTAIAREKKNRA